MESPASLYTCFRDKCKKNLLILFLLLYLRSNEHDKSKYSMVVAYELLGVL